MPVMSQGTILDSTDLRYEHLYIEARSVCLKELPCSIEKR
jgi:hypothetical protein